MSPDIKDMAAKGAKTAWCTTWTFTVNTGRRAKILGRHTLAWWQQRKIDRALQKLGGHTFQALEQGESDPLAKSEVKEAAEKARELQALKEKNYQAMEAIRERIRTSCVIPTPEEPGGVEENPPVP
jgi:hypothetical protein